MDSHANPVGQTSALPLRVWLRPGARGLHVRQLEEGLRRVEALGRAPGGHFDAVVGNAVGRVQAAQGFSPSPDVDENLWRFLAGSSGPSLFCRAVSCIAQLRGDLTWGSSGIGRGGLEWGICRADARSGVLGNAVRRLPGEVVVAMLGKIKAAQLLEMCGWDRARRSFSGHIVGAHGDGNGPSAFWTSKLEAMSKTPLAPGAQLGALHAKAWMPMRKQLGPEATEKDALVAFWRRLQRGVDLEGLPLEALTWHGLSDVRLAADETVDDATVLLDQYGVRASR